MNNGEIVNRVGGIITGTVKGNAVIREHPLIQVTTVTELSTTTVTSGRAFISTVTSTSYSYRYVATATLTQFATSRLIALRQDNMLGPYIQIKGSFRYWYDPTNLVVDRIYGDVTIANLLNIPVDRGMMYLSVSNVEGTVTEEVATAFVAVKVGETISVTVSVPVTKTYYHEKIRISFLRADLHCGAGMTTMVPTATYTYSGTQTHTYVRIYILQFTVQEPPRVESADMPTIWLIPVVTGAAVLALIAFLVGKKKPPTQAAQASLQNAYVGCVFGRA